MKTEEVSSQNSSKFIIGVVGVLIAILVLSSIIYELKKSENWESFARYYSGKDSPDKVWWGVGYVGTNWGVGTLEGENWETFATQYSPHNSYGDDFIGIAIDSSDSVWFAEDDEISVFDGENWDTVTTPQWGDDYVEAFAMDSSERLWFGTETHGVSVFDGEKWERYTPLNSGLGGKWVDVISIDSSDRLWFGNENGVSVFDGEEWERYTTQNSGLGSNSVSAIAFDSSNKVWFGTYGEGVSVFDGEKWERYTTQNSGLGDDFVTALAIDSSDSVWFGSLEHGVSVFDGENWVTYTEDNSGILSGWIQQIVADRQGSMWIGTNKGISRVPIGERLHISPLIISIRDLFFSPRLSLWLNLVLLVILGYVAINLADRRKAMDEQEPIEENKVVRRRLALQGAAGRITERTQVGRRFWLWWMLASTLVLAVGVTVGGVGILIGAAFGGVGVLVGAVLGGVFGALLGIAQRLVLRRQVSWSGRWVLPSAVGGAASFAIGVAIVINFLPYRPGFIFGSFNTKFLAETVLGIVVVIGASLGIAQWLVLRWKVDRSGWWILASTAGPAVIYLVLFFVTLFALDRIEGFSERTSTMQLFSEGILTEEKVTTYDDPQRVTDGAVKAGVVGAVFGYGAITGGALVWLLRQSEETEFRLDRRTRTRLLLAAVFLIVAMAGYFLVAAVQANRATIKANNIIAGLQVPPCSEVYVAPLIRDRRVTTCHIKRAYCDFSICSDAPFESRSFILVLATNAGFRLDDFDGECLLVTGEASGRAGITSMIAYDQSDVEICQ